MHAICAFLGPALKRHILDKFEGNTSAAAEAIGLNQSFTWRLINDSQKKMGFFDAIRIYEEVGIQDDSLLKEYFPRDYQTYGSALGARRSKELLKSFRYAFSKKSHSEVYLYVWSRNSRSVEEVITEFGRRGHIVLEDLIEKNALDLSEGVVKPKAADIAFSDSLTTKLVTKRIIESTDLDIPGTISRYFCEGINEATHAAAVAKLTNTAHEIIEMFRDPKNHGSVVFIGTITAGPMNPSMETRV